MDPIRLEIFLDDKTAAGIGSVGNGLKGMEQVGTVALESLKAQMEQLRIKVEQLNAQGLDTSAEQKQLEDLKRASAALTTELDSLRQAKLENAQTALMDEESDPAPKINNLKMSITQVARELPSLAMGPQVFFMAVSNNLPMVQDAIKQARVEHDALVASGQKATPVWRQVVSSLVSWQTALAVGISLLVVYGKDIWNFAHSLFGVKQATVEAMQASEDFQESVSSGSAEMASKLMELSAEFVALGSNIEAQNQFIANNQRRFDDLGLSISNVSEAESALINNTDKVIQAMMARAQAAAASETMQQELQKAMELRKEWQDESDTYTYQTYSGMPFFGKWETITTRNSKKDKKRKAYDDQIARIKELSQFQQEQKSIADSILKSIGLGVSDKNNPDAGTLAGLDAEIRLKKAQQQAVNTREAYQELQKEIDKLEEKRLAITGKTGKSSKTGKGAQYDPSEDRLKLLRENQQKEIGLMAEGSEKKRKQLALDYSMQLDDIKKMEAKLSKASGGKLKDDDLEQIRKAYGMADAEYLQGLEEINRQEQEEQQKHLDKLLEKYRNYDAQRKALQEAADKDIADMQKQRNADNADAIDAAIEEAKTKLQEGLQSINNAEAEQATKDSPFLRNLFGDFSEMAFVDLQKLIQQGRQLQDYLNGNGSKEGITFISPEQLEAIEASPDKLEALKKALKQLLNEGEKGDKWKQLFETFKKGLEDLRDAESFEQAAGGIAKMSAAAGTAVGELSDMAEAFGAVGAAETLGNIETALSAVTNIGEAFAKGGIFGGAMAVIGETAKLFAKGAAEERKHQEALRQLAAARLEQQRSYNLLLLEQNLLYKQAETVFGSNPYGKAVNALNVYKDAVTQLKKELHGDGKYDGGLMDEYYRMAGVDYSKKDAFAGLADIQIVDGSKTKGAWFWKKQKDVYKSVLDVYPELIDAQGNFNKELAKTILDSRKMSDESKVTLQHFIDLAEQQEEAMNTMKEYLTDIFGSLGNSLSDALVDAFRNGSSAADEFQKSVVSMLEQLAQQMAYSVTLAPIFEKASEKMMEVMNKGLAPDQAFKEYAAIITGVMNEGLSAQKDFNKLLQAAKEAAKDKGLDLFLPEEDKASGSSQTASVGGFAALTQEQGTKLEGLFVGVYDRMVSIHSLVQSLANDRQTDSRLLAEIAHNTAYCRYLLNIYELVERMDRDGITVK